MGLQPKFQNLVILAFAAQTDRTPVRNGTPVQASLERIDDTVELREEPLPDEFAWTKARERASALFGLTPGEVRKGATVTRFAADLKATASEKRGQLTDFVRGLRPRAEALGVPASAPRFATIASALALAGDLVGAADAVSTVNVLAGAAMDTSEAAVSHLMASVEDLRASLSTTTWEIIESAIGLTDQRAAAAAGLREKLIEALAADQHVIALRPVLRDVQSSATRLLREGRAYRLSNRPRRLRHPRRCL